MLELQGRQFDSGLDSGGNPKQRQSTKKNDVTKQ